MRPTKIFWFLLPLLLVIDQATKAWVLHSFGIRGYRNVIPGVFQITYVQNTGVAFGFFAGKNLWLAAFTLLVIALAAWWAWQLNWKRRETNVIAAMILAGALGNLIDRFRYGFVVDFLDFHAIGYPWVFNFADSCITLSMVWIICRQIFPAKQRDAASH